jgi:hypothetical protein
MPFVCGLVQHRVQNRLHRGWWSWPFGRADVGERGLLAYSPVFRRWAVEIPYREISGAVLKPSRLGGQIRVHRTEPKSGHVSLMTVGDSYLRIAERLREQGVEVAGVGRSRGRKTDAS